MMIWRRHTCFHWNIFMHRRHTIKKTILFWREVGISWNSFISVTKQMTRLLNTFFILVISLTWIRKQFKMIEKDIHFYWIIFIHRVKDYKNDFCFTDRKKESFKILSLASLNKWRDILPPELHLYFESNSKYFNTVKFFFKTSILIFQSDWFKNNILKFNIMKKYFYKFSFNI